MISRYAHIFLIATLTVLPPSFPLTFFTLWRENEVFFSLLLALFLHQWERCKTDAPLSHIHIFIMQESRIKKKNTRRRVRKSSSKKEVTVLLALSPGFIASEMSKVLFFSFLSFNHSSKIESRCLWRCPHASVFLFYLVQIFLWARLFEAGIWESAVSDWKWLWWSMNFLSGSRWICIDLSLHFFPLIALSRVISQHFPTIIFVSRYGKSRFFFRCNRRSFIKTARH